MYYLILVFTPFSLLLFFLVSYVSVFHENIRDIIAFKTEMGDISIGEVGQSFWDKGMLTTRLVDLGVCLLVDKFKGSLTMVAPYHICVRMQKFLFYFLIFFSDFRAMTCFLEHYLIFGFVSADKYLEWWYCRQEC